MTLEASRVTLARQRAGLSKSALAHKTGTTPRTVTTWESAGPPSSRLHQIATITGMPPEFFSTKEIDLLEEKQLFFRLTASFNGLRSTGGRVLQVYFQTF